MTSLSQRKFLWIGCAGWSIPGAMTNRFPQGDSRLERYAQRFDCVEVNSSFHRPHRPATYRRWAGAVPPAFRFAVKMPRSISHDARLCNTGNALRAFLDPVRELGGKLGCLLLQLPPSLAFTAAEALPFLDQLAQLYHGPVACEPRHQSWFRPTVDRELRERGVARVAADPARCLRAAVPGGTRQFEYFRMHGSPRTYYDAYDEAALCRITRRLRRPDGTVSRWCICDNSALGHSVANAMDLVGRLAGDAR